MPLALPVVVLAATSALAEEANDTPDARGVITLVKAEPAGLEPRGISVEGPSSDPCDNAGYFQVKGGTKILRDGRPADFGDLEVGQSVEAYYEGDLGTSCPPAGVAGRIVILPDADKSASGTAATLVETGGLSPVVAGGAGAALLSAGVLVRALVGYRFR